MAGHSPNRALEQRLRQAIMSRLHELVPEFRSHVARCASCSDFHDWVEWRHREGTNEWHAECPATGATLIVPFMLAGTSGGDQPQPAPDSTTY